MKNFSTYKDEFNKKFASKASIDCFLPMHLTHDAKKSIKSKNGLPNEEYYRWQFFYAIINSGMYAKDFIGVEVHFPKGNVNSSPIKFDGAIFDDESWFEHYTNYHKSKEL